jgi:D-sedoheptulose 7-phosphate isomerase
MEKIILKSIEKSAQVKLAVLKDKAILSEISKSAQAIVDAFKENKKLLLCGNGGSAADAQHIAAELSGRFYIDRAPLDAEALHVNPSYITAVANDYGYEMIYERMVEAKTQSGDVLIAISTSGNSPNVLKAAKKAKELGAVTIGFTGEKESELSKLCDFCLKVPSNDTPRIQECHILFGHIICEIVENQLFGNSTKK